MKKPKIVILGTGFGGIYTCLSLIKRLKKNEAEILLINRKNYFLFTPLLHEVATGGLGEEQVVESVRSIIYNTCANFLMAEVKKIDLDKKTVQTSTGTISYDYLVIALGATTNFYGIPGAEENSFVLKDLAQAASLRNNFISVFEEASRTADAERRKKMLSFAVIGGGPTGVELVAEMADLFFDTFRTYYKGHICKDDVSLYLINKADELMPELEPVLREKSLEVLWAKGVKVLLGRDVTEVTKSSVIFADGSSVAADHIIWTAGVKPHAVAFNKEPEKDKVGRIVVDDYLRVKNFAEVFALGDIASCIPTFAESTRPLPMLAQVAVEQGKSVGKNIFASMRRLPLKKFNYQSKGSLVSLGQWQAVGKTFGITWKGPIAWWVWRTAYLFNFASWPKRLKIAIDWTVDMFYPRDITKP